MIVTGCCSERSMYVRTLHSRSYGAECLQNSMGADLYYHVKSPDSLESLIIVHVHDDMTRNAAACLARGENLKAASQARGSLGVQKQRDFEDAVIIRATVVDGRSV